MSLGNATFGGFIDWMGLSPAIERPTHAGLRLGAYALESETPALHSEVQKQAAFGIIRVYSGNSWFKCLARGHPSRMGSFGFPAGQDS